MTENKAEIEYQAYHTFEKKWMMHPIEVNSMTDEKNPLHKVIYEEIFPRTSVILNAYLNEGTLNDDDGNELDWEDAKILIPLMNMIVVAILMEKMG